MSGVYQPTREAATVSRGQHQIVMAGLDPAIHDFLCRQDVDARDKPGHDEKVEIKKPS
ncbi:MULTISPECIES: hypothetical protein [Bradyrhizobium]|uniref:hypothetical protein n=1 Tax=Bradyrhizobium TaxID=374 RepID=UPI0012AB830F|nr:MULTISPECIES: hypothetical protein [Bradyrhizobium]